MRRLTHSQYNHTVRDLLGEETRPADQFPSEDFVHGFTNQAYDILRVLGGEAPTVPIPDFEDAYQTQRVLEASLLAAEERRPVKMDEVK